MADLIELLRSAVAEVGKATPGEWRWSHNGNIILDPYTDDCEIAAVYSEHMDDSCPDNAAAIIAAVTFLRDHGETLAAALEAAREDARALARVRALPEKWRASPEGTFPDSVVDCAADLDAAIDQARGKGGGEVG